MKPLISSPGGRRSGSPTVRTSADACTHYAIASMPDVTFYHNRRVQHGQLQPPVRHAGLRAVRLRGVLQPPCVAARLLAKRRVVPLGFESLKLISPCFLQVSSRTPRTTRGGTPSGRKPTRRCLTWRSWRRRSAPCCPESSRASENGATTVHVEGANIKRL